jgi:hypothetical protein
MAGSAAREPASRAFDGMPGHSAFLGDFNFLAHWAAHGRASMV